MDIYIMVAKNILYDSYCEEEPVESNEYSSFYSNDVLYHRKIRDLLKPYGKFNEDYFDNDWHWYSFSINELGRQFIENKETLDYIKEKKDCNWYEVSISFVLMGLLCYFAGGLIYGLTDLINELNYINNLRLFQFTTIAIIVSFLLIVKSIYNGVNKNRNKYILISSALLLVYMIFYEFVMEYIIEYTYEYYESGYETDGLLMKVQFGCLGTILWYLFCRKSE